MCPSVCHQLTRNNLKIRQNFISYVPDIERQCMASARYWGDERQSDAVFAIYLRKVRYVPPNNYRGITHYRPIDPDVGPNGHVDHLQWETVKERVIKAGTLTKLLDCLFLTDGEMDPRHFNVFFSTFRPFASPFDVLRLLLVKYDDLVNGRTPTKSTKHRNILLNSIRSVLIFWLDMFREDFIEPPRYPCLTELVEFSRQYKTQLADVLSKAQRFKEKCISLRITAGSRRYSLEKHSLALKFESLDYILSPARHKTSDVTSADAAHVAEQLTYWDAELFKQLIPHQCQSFFWSKRHQKGLDADKVYSVRATVDQFNAVSRRVMTSVVFLDIKPSTRARIISKWIEIARELRIMKNFSSLKAVISGLQSEPVHRLKQTWAHVSNEDVQEFNQLARIFGGDEPDGIGARRILEKEGTAKTVDNFLSVGKDVPAKRTNRHRRAKSDMSEAQGTVPYLGTFLTDLTMIDEAYQDEVEDGLINFEKRRKEFEVLAQLKLFQSAARSYRVSMEPKFPSWFQCLPSLPEQDCYRRSLEIEQPTTSTPDLRTQSRNQHRKTHSKDTISKIYAHLFGDDVPEEDNWFSVVPQENGGSMPRSQTAPATPGSNGSSIGNSVFYPGSEFSPQDLFSRTKSSGGTPSCSLSYIGWHPSSASLSNGSLPSVKVTPASPYKRNVDTNFYILKVGLDESLLPEHEDGPLYKCIRLENGDRLPWVIDKALQKHLLPGSAQDYSLVQILSDGREFSLPEGCNPFYAIVPGGDELMLNFLLRRKDSGSGISATLGFIKKKKRRRSNLLRWSSGFL